MGEGARHLSSVQGGSDISPPPYWQNPRDIGLWVGEGQFHVDVADCVEPSALCLAQVLARTIRGGGERSGVGGSPSWEGFNMAPRVGWGGAPPRVLRCPLGKAPRGLHQDYLSRLDLADHHQCGCCMFVHCLCGYIVFRLLMARRRYWELGMITGTDGYRWPWGGGWILCASWSVCSSIKSLGIGMGVTFLVSSSSVSGRGVWCGVRCVVGEAKDSAVVEVLQTGRCVVCIDASCSIALWTRRLVALADDL
ncbi:hypothetical protein Tco_0669317 [Tanacetum coccineum]